MSLTANTNNRKIYQMVEITGKLETRQLSEGHTVHNLTVTFNEGSMSHSMFVDFIFDNTEDYSEEVETDDPNIVMFVGKQRTVETYHIRYGDNGICNINIFNDFANLIKSNATFKSQMGSVTKFGTEAYNTIFGNLTFSEGKLLIVNESTSYFNKDVFSIKVTEYNERSIADSLRAIDTLITETFDRFHGGAIDVSP